MRPSALLFALLLTVPLAGCMQPAPSTGLDAAGITVPEGAALVELAQGFRLDFGEQDLPFTANVTLPEGATIATLTVDPGAGETVTLGTPTARTVGMVSAETGRRRCNSPVSEGLGVAQRGVRTCSGLTVIDSPGDMWTLRVWPGTALKAKVAVDLLETPLDGLPALLDLSQLSRLEHAVLPTQVLSVPSFDGTALRVEVTRPEGPGPWPTVLASSPYNNDGKRIKPAMWEYWVHDFAARGYASVVADVRGFGDSGGCAEVWGPKEQEDQAFLVEWAAAQPWSDGHVGFYGQSYVGTTPVEAAVLDPPHLDAIIAVAPVINAYEDWHFGGVPNGESFLSPYSYQYQQDPDPRGVPPPSDPTLAVLRAANGVCDPTVLARPNDPRAVYDAFYQERDFKARAGAVKAAVLYTQGFLDENVKSAMVPGWFDALTAPKLGLFGHWNHQHPTRMDQEVLFLAWFDTHLKGRDLGLEHLATSYVLPGDGLERAGTTWPPEAPGVTIYPDAETLSAQPGDGPGTLSLAATAPGTLVSKGPGLEGALAGTPVLHIKGQLQGGGNAYIGAALYEEGTAPDGGDRLLTWGWFNLAHRQGHETYVPVAPGETVAATLPFRPIESVLHGKPLRLELVPIPAEAYVPPPGTVPPGVPWADPGRLQGIAFTFEGGAEGTRLELPILGLDAYHPQPVTART